LAGSIKSENIERRGENGEEKKQKKRRVRQHIAKKPSETIFNRSKRRPENQGRKEKIAFSIKRRARSLGRQKKVKRDLEKKKCKESNERKRKSSQSLKPGNFFKRIGRERKLYEKKALRAKEEQGENNSGSGKGKNPVTLAGAIQK